MSYLPVELHCHTVHSDGDFTPRQLQNAAVEDHLSLIALTDHNTFSGVSELDESICPFVPGIEWTTYFGHMLVLGANEFVDWRDAAPDNIDEKIKEIKAVGGIAGIAHPYQLGSPMCTGGRWEFNVRNWRNIDYIEIWHEDFKNDNFENDKGMELWTSLLDKGYHIAATYGRDWHRPSPPDKHFGCTYLHFENSAASAQGAIKAIRLGKTVVSTGAKLIFRVHRMGKTFGLGSTVPKGNVTFSFFVDLHSRLKNEGKENIEYKTIKIVTNGGKTALETRCDERHVRLRIEKGHWYRAELWGTVNGDKKILAVTSPIYCE
ncbi:MAG: CehA/McbA family metallohydrolase [Clostridiales bacterium]|nr:CehA/McbA family metallohydrolase [Clostridiales bacterium]